MTAVARPLHARRYDSTRQEAGRIRDIEVSDRSDQVHIRDNVEDKKGVIRTLKK